MHSSTSLGGHSQYTAGIVPAASSASNAAQAASSNASSSSLASSLALLAGHDTQHRIKELLPGDTSARTELLLSLLKSSYSSSLHSADVRMATLTQELVAARAQLAYGESKLRSVEALAEEAGRAAEEQKKRAELLQQENVRLKAENQALKAENAQLAHFKTLLLSAAHGMAPPQQAAASLALSLPAPYSNAQQALHAANAASNAAAASPAPPAEADWMHRQSANAAAQQSQQAQQQQQQQPQTQFFFSPVKSSRGGMNESIALSNVPTSFPPQHQSSAATGAQSTPAPAPRPRSDYVYMMPSPLSADALASPSPQRNNNHNHQQQQHDGAEQQQQQRNASATTAAAASPDILHEINAHLSSSRGGKAASPVSSPMRNGASNHQQQQHHSNGYVPAAPSASSLVDQARALFHTAQARLPAHTFTEFVSLVQQFRSAASASNGATHSTAGSGGGSWEAIRQQAAGLLAPWQDIHALFEQLLHATQVQQQQQAQQQQHQQHQR